MTWGTLIVLYTDRFCAKLAEWNIQVPAQTAKAVSCHKPCMGD